MERLLRTRSGAFKIEDSHSLAELEEIFAKVNNFSSEKSSSDQDNDGAISITATNNNISQIKDVLLSADTCFMEYPALHCKEKYDSVLLNGNLMRMRHFKEYIEVADPINRVYDSHNDFKALYEWVEERKLYRPLKVFISTKE